MAWDRSEESATLRRIFTLLTVTLAVAGLYVARDVVLPLAMAVLLTFLLTPLVTWLERWRLGRIPSVLIVVAVAFAAIGAVGWVITHQLIGLTADLPEYKDTLIDKIRSIRGPMGSSGGIFSDAADTVKQLIHEISSTPAEAEQAVENSADALDTPPPASAVPVQVVEPGSSLPAQFLRQWLGPLLSPFGTAAVVVVFVIFMLIKREDLRNRLIRLPGTSHLYATTQAMDETALRVSKYLQMLLIINASYGVAVAIGLWLIGVPNAILWGLLAMLFRFVPYVGPWVAAALPIALSLAAFDGWTRPLATIALFVVLELFSNNIIEPWLYGTKTGVSVVGIIASALFWTWLWGPLGLMLAMPLTVCLTVLGRYVPQLGFLNILLSDEPALELNQQFYQRLLALDYHEASEVADEYLKGSSLHQFYDNMMAPALSLAERDRQSGNLSDSERRFIYDSVRDMVNEAGESFERQQPSAAETHTAAPTAEQTVPMQSRRVLCLPAQDDADEIAGAMAAQLLRTGGHQAQTLSAAESQQDLMAQVDRFEAEAVIVSAVAPGGAIPARDLVRKLRKKFPDLKIIVGLWNAAGPLSKTRERLSAAGADAVVTRLTEGVDQLQRLFTSPQPVEVSA